MSTWTHRWRRVRRFLAGVFAALIILLAVTMALGQLLVPLIAHYPTRVARLLSDRLHQPVAFETVRGDWQPSGPLLKVSGLRIGTGEAPLRLPEAELKIDFGAWLKPDRRWLELRVRDASAHLGIDSLGLWHLSGFELGNQATGGGAEQLGDLPVGLLLRDLQLQIHDQRNNRTTQLHVSALRVLTRGQRLHLGGRIRQPGGEDTVQLAAWVDPQQRSGKVYVGGDNIDLADWGEMFDPGDTRVRGGHGRLRVWLGWHQGRMDHLTTEFRLAGLVLQRKGKAVLELPRWNGLLQAQGNRQQWQLRWQPGDDQTATASGWFAIQQAAPHQWRMQARHVDMGALSPWLALWPRDGDGNLPALASLRPYGRLDRLSMHWRSSSNFTLHAAFHGLGWKPVGALPGVNHLDGTVRGDGEAVSVRVPTQAVTIRYPGVFRKPLVFSRVRADVALWQAASGWRVGTDDLSLQADDFAVRLRGSVSAPVGKGMPVLDVAARVTEARVSAAKLFWPIPSMSAGTMAWLDRGLVSGDVSGRALFRGPLDEWPFKQQQGRFEAVADFRDTVLDYDADWPVAEKLDGRAVFVDLGMHVATTAGSSLGNSTDTASAEIAHFDHPLLDLDIRGQGRSDRLLTWLRNTPVGKEHAAALAPIRLSGPASYAINLKLPLYDDPGATTRLDGRVQFANSRLRVPDWSLDIEHLGGPLYFDTGGVHGNELTADYNSTPVTLAARIGDATRQADATLEASMQGQFNAGSLLKSYPSLSPIADMVQGSALFNIGLDIRADGDQGSATQGLSVDTDMQGMALLLPAPLHKSAALVQPLHIQMGLPVEGSDLSLRLGEVAQGRLRLASKDQPLSADIALAEPAKAAPARGIRVHGKVDVLEVSGWLERILAATDARGTAPMPSPVMLAIHSDSTHVVGADLGPLDLMLDQQDSDYVLSAKGKLVEGKISIPTADIATRGITARLDRLYWPESDAGQDKTDAQSTVAPSALPPLHVWVKDLRLGLARLGDVRFESVPAPDGMQVEQFEAQSPDLKISARGSWLGSANDNQSHLAIDLSSEDLGRMLTAFGYTRLVVGGATLAHIDGRWPGPPSSFSLADLNGSLQVHVADGRILEVEPGMGRLFGLFSIRELPRRLSLDFGDIFQSGYSFNTIEGNFRFADGSAYTDDLTMLGPSADIRITGRTGVRQHDYDQQILVTPHLGVALPVVGAIAGGPIGAAAGLAIQGLLGKGINRAGQAHYKVTGSWDKPDIERIARGADSKSAPAAPAGVLQAPAPDRVLQAPSPSESAATGAAEPGVAGSAGLNP
ncbi:MAG: YhdP family protein [Rhodanobacteraceae bacterium]